jgi:hypothetical protein
MIIDAPHDERPDAFRAQYAGVCGGRNTALGDFRYWLRGVGANVMSHDAIFAVREDRKIATVEHP